MNTGSALARFTITLSQAVTEPVQVEWFTSDGTAKAGVDYAANKGTVVFAPGETAKTVDILVYGRAVGTEDRSFFVEMLPPTNAILGASIGECIIHVDTTGSTPVTQIIVPTGPQGIQGKSAYQSYLDTTTDNPPMTEAEWVESLKGDPAEIAQEVAPLIDVGATVLTAEGTESLSNPDQTTVKAVARRVAYAGATKIATVSLADGDNYISQVNLTGDTIDFSSNSLLPRIVRGGSFIKPSWNIVADGRLLIKSAIAGDMLYVCQYDLAPDEKLNTNSRELWTRTLADAGYTLVAGSFEKGATINSATDAIWHVSGSQCYLWGGALPKIVPEKSNPGSTGGVSSGAWVSVSGKLLSSVLKSADGAKAVFKGKVSIDAILPHTPEEFLTGDMDAAFAASLAASASDGRRTVLSGTKVTASTVSLSAGVTLQNDGVVESSASTAAISLLSGARLQGGKIESKIPSSAARIWQGVNDVKMLSVTAHGSVTSATAPGYAVELYQANDFTIRDANLSGYTGAINLQQTNRAVIDGLTAKEMYYHATLVAGGYGVLTGGSNDTIVNNFNFIAGDTNTADGYTGRHAIYHSVLRLGGVNYACTNAIFNNVIANYRDKTVESAGAINIRWNNRTIFSNIIADGSHVSGTPEDGNITSNIFSQGIIRARKRAEGVTKYGFSWGATQNGFSAIGNITANSIISVSPDSGITPTLCYAYELTGRNHLLGNLILDVPAESTPIIVRAGVSNVLISDIVDPVANPTAPFILFEGGSNITLKGIKTARQMFGSIGNVTDLTVDFPRTSTISINSGTVTLADPNAIFDSVTVSATNIVVNFKPHVTQAAVNNAIASIGKTTAPNMPIIISRGTKSMIIEFYALSNGARVDPTATAINFTVSLSC